jgi:hypothetical protein
MLNYMGLSEEEVRKIVRQELSEVLRSQQYKRIYFQPELQNLTTISEAARRMGYRSNEGFLTEWKKLGYPVYRYGNGHPRVALSDLAELQRKSKISI